jgi:hypothetical protein
LAELVGDVRGVQRARLASTEATNRFCAISPVRRE